MKSHIPAGNIPTRIDDRVVQSFNVIRNTYKERLKRGRPVGSKDKNPQKKKRPDNQNGLIEETGDHEQT